MTNSQTQSEKAKEADAPKVSDSNDTPKLSQEKYPNPKLQIQEENQALKEDTTILRILERKKWR